LRETEAGFEALQAGDRIRHWGVSNFDLGDTQALTQLPDRDRCEADQATTRYYSLSERGAEYDLAPRQRNQSMPLMACCPLDRADPRDDSLLRKVAARHDPTASQVALAQLMAHPRGSCPYRRRFARRTCVSTLRPLASGSTKSTTRVIEPRFAAPHR
jgi:diketogulonate reductase-like aldo/keto reductase